MNSLLIETESLELDTGTDPLQKRHADSVALPLLLEVGCEEIPARFLRDAEKGLGERVLAALKESRLVPEFAAGPVHDAPPMPVEPLVARPAELQTYSTPRRLVVHIPALLAHQPDKVEEILGPPVKVSVDPHGNYTRAAQSFAQKNSVRLEDLGRATTPKGEYLSLQKITHGRSAREILREILPAAILGLSFPKSMYWRSKSDPRFVRPIRWIVALLGEGKRAQTIEFELLGVKSANFTFGHRATGLKQLFVSGFKDYTNTLTQSFVEIDYSKRCERIVQEAQGVLGDTPRILVQDAWLVDWIANSTEWPRPMLGSFDRRFLHLPREILITVMRDHQRYFALETVGTNGVEPAKSAELAPCFVAVLNMDSDEKGLIRQGHQRVLTARFRDAEFFWDGDQKLPLRDRLALLEKVTYQEKLGTYGDKVRRLKQLTTEICASLDDVIVPAHDSAAAQEGLSKTVLRAVELCKCDLTTQMVQEFTELQGVVGGLYARAQGEPEEIAVAIYDHYLPMGAEGASPRSLLGALVSLADKLDSVVAGFAVGNDPTGSSDPFALRRQGNGAIKVILELNLPISLGWLVDTSIESLEIQQHAPQGEGVGSPTAESRLRPSETQMPGARVGAKPSAAGRGRDEVRARVLEFFAERLRFYLESVRHSRYDTVRAVLAAGSERPADAQSRAEAMESLRGGENFEALSAAAKRIRNILAKSASAADWQVGEVDVALLTEQQEKDLYAAYAKVASEALVCRQAGDYRRALETISTLRPAVDCFFDKVLVMAEDRAVRQNRLRLLDKLDDLFSGIAHFAEIEGQ
jgi:glycyl-tRNA synthetase beta chain